MKPISQTKVYKIRIEAEDGESIEFNAVFVDNEPFAWSPFNPSIANSDHSCWPVIRDMFDITSG